MAFQTARGTRDFLPEDMILRESVFSTVKKVFERYGFYPLETPAFEEIGVLEAKCGEEIKKEIYRLEGTEFGLRFDLTVPLARVVAGNADLTKPFKRYCIGRVWRREEPQKGRFREFWQADVDIVGSAGMACDAECIAAAVEALRELGFRRLVVKLNSRRLLDAIVIKAGVGREKEFDVFRSLDKLEKIEEKGVGRELEERGIEPEKIEKLMDFVKIRGSTEEKLARIEKLVEGIGTGEEGIGEIRQIISLLRSYGISEIDVDFSLVRGLDYYTGPIYEIKIPEGDIGSVAGGGRFDGLIELYGAPKTPAAGISLGIERIIEVMKKFGMVERRKTGCALYIAPVKPEFSDYARKVLVDFRKAGINAEIDLMERSLRKQLDYANSMGIPFVAMIGEKERKERKVTLRDFKSGKESLLSVPEAVKTIRK